MDHLRISTLGDLPAHVKVPNYDPRAVGVGVAHIGATSNFGASNIMPFFDSALATQASKGQPLTMGVVAIKTTGGPLPLALRHRDQQDNLYTVVGRNGHDEVRVIGSVREVMNYSADQQAVIERLADPKIKIITITATQAGYVLNKDGNGIDEAKPEVLNDMRNPWRPVTVPGILVAALALREQKGIEPPVVVSCDNLADNGAKLGKVLTQYAEATGICSPTYMAKLSTPNTMVDRITPAQDFDANQRMLASKHRILDSAAIVAEGFSKWVIEQRGNAVDVRLAPLAAGGVKIVQDLKPHEDMKIRGLNGAHLALGLVGTLAGEELVHKAVAQPAIRPFIATLLDQAAATVKLPATETSGLRQEVLGRFSNQEMPDKLQRLLTETSSKVSARLVNYEAIKNGKGFEASAFAVAAWMRYMRGEDDNGNRMSLADTRASELSNRVQAANFNTERFLHTAGARVFDVAVLGSDGANVAKPFFAKVDRYYNDICSMGVLSALERAFGLDHSVAAPSRPADPKQMVQDGGAGRSPQMGGAAPKTPQVK